MFPADGVTTTSATGAVKLKIEERGIASIPPLSIPTLLQRTVSRHMDKPALCVKRDGQVRTVARERAGNGDGEAALRARLALLCRVSCC